MKFKFYLFFLLFTAASLSSSAQNGGAFLSNAARSLSAHFNTHPVEKVYLHLDRPYYNTADTIWFKAYTVVGQRHQLSALSGVLYCELINSKDSVITRHTLKLKTGMAWGDFILPSSIKPGSYHIRAYTNWMRNAGAEYFYNQAIRIGVPQPVLALQKRAVSARPDVQFFPEGGELVNGLRSRVAVKSLSPNGLGEDISGIITDNDGNEVAAFATQHLGMGVFALIPQAGKSYKAKITCADSSKYTIDLPKAQDEGFTLSINNSGADSVYVKVAANDKMFQGHQNSTFYLVAQSGSKVYYTAEGKLAGPVFTTLIPKTRFPSGITQFTLFSQTGEALNERVIFIQNEDLKVTVSSLSQTYSPRQKVKIDLATKSENAGPIAGSFSVSVINESRVPVDENAESTILNNLLLTSDLKGHIEQPNYYFNNINDETRSNLELLMLTQGYRRFEWKKVLNNTEFPVVYQPEKSLELAGSIKTLSGKPVPNGKITFLATKENFLADTVTDVNGNFKFTNVDLSDTAKIVLRARKEHNGSNVAIYVKQKDYPAIIRQKEIIPDLSPVLTEAMKKNLADYERQLKEDSLKNGKQLKEVTIKDKKLSKPDSYNNYGTALEYNVDMKRLSEEFIVMTEALIYVVPGMTYMNGRFSYEHSKVRVIIDGIERTTDDLNYFSAKEIDNIRMISATNITPATLVLTTRRSAGTDTTTMVHLKEVTVTSKNTNKKTDLENSSNLNGPGNADQVIKGNTLEGCVTLSDCLQGKVFGVTFRDGIPYSTRTQGRLSGSVAMVIIIDGAQLDGSALNDLNANDIYSIEVLRSGALLAIYGSNAPGGALVITTRHSGETDYLTSQTPLGLIVYPFKGYYKARMFYSPKYEGPKTDTQQPDLRSTIYWNPIIITGNDGKATFEYFNADTKGTYRVVVEGIDNNGNLGRRVYRYKVE
jgi:TonB-dependent Receptor Plug Domain